jgi:hypothetical protein
VIGVDPDTLATDELIDYGPEVLGLRNGLVMVRY